jgi:hypothetical protein
MISNFPFSSILFCWLGAVGVDCFVNLLRITAYQGKQYYYTRYGEIRKEYIDNYCHAVSLWYIM